MPTYTTSSFHWLTEYGATRIAERSVALWIATEVASRDHESIPINQSTENKLKITNSTSTDVT